MAKKILIMLALFCVLQSTYGQTPDINHEKYWFYRYRLTDQFMKLGQKDCGSPAGFSIPAGNAFSKPDAIDIHFGDGTSFLGYYIGVLATEYQLLLNSGSSTDKTLDELYQAMLAYERLDRNAEVLMAPINTNDCSSTLNGFFLRDDVDSTILDHMKTTELGKASKYNSFDSDYYQGKTKGTASNLNTDPHRFPSQDQIANLLVGFALVRKIIPSTIVWKGYNFNGMAQTYTNLIMTYLQQRNWIMIHPSYSASALAQNYVQGLIDCMSSSITPSGPVFSPKTCLSTAQSSAGLIKYGLEILPNVYGFAKAGERIYNAQWGGHAVDIGSNITAAPTSGVYSSGIIGLSAYKIWNNAYGYPAGLNYFGLNYQGTQPDAHVYANAYMAAMAAVGNSWELGFTSYPFKTISFQIPFPCSSVTMSDPICLLRAFGKCRLSVRYPVVNVWNCPQTETIGVYCYQNNLGTVLTNTITNNVVGLIPGIGKFTGYILSVLNSLGGDLTLCAPFNLPNIAYNTTSLGLSEYGKQYGLELYPLLHHYLHNVGDYTIGANSIQSIVNTAPCNGPNYQSWYDPNVNATGMGGKGVSGWQWDNRFEQGGKNRTEDDQHSSYNGIDYMLLYNLHTLVNGNGNIPVKDLRYNSVSNLTFPLGSDKNYDGSDLNPDRTVGFKTLTVDNVTVNSGNSSATNGNVTFQASDEIILTNFVTEAGSNAIITTDPIYPCNRPSGIQYRIEEAQEEQLPDSAAVSQRIRDSLVVAIKKYYKSPESKITAYEPLANYLARMNGSNAASGQASSAIASSTLTLFPSPLAKGNLLKLSFAAPQATSMQVTVVDALGQTIYTSEEWDLAEGNNSLELPYDFPSQGIFYVNCTTPLGKETKKVIVIDKK